MLNYSRFPRFCKNDYIFKSYEQYVSSHVRSQSVFMMSILYILLKNTGILQEQSICQPNKPFDKMSPFVVQKEFEGLAGTPVSVRR